MYCQLVHNMDQFWTTVYLNKLWTIVGPNSGCNITMSTLIYVNMDHSVVEKIGTLLHSYILMKPRNVVMNVYMNTYVHLTVL